MSYTGTFLIVHTVGGGDKSYSCFVTPFGPWLHFLVSSNDHVTFDNDYVTHYLYGTVTYKLESRFPGKFGT
jgi:hypothetical protein